MMVMACSFVYYLLFSLNQSERLGTASEILRWATNKILMGRVQAARRMFDLFVQIWINLQAIF